jgi:hypothetical protein
MSRLLVKHLNKEKNMLNNALDVVLVNHLNKEILFQIHAFNTMKM